MEFTVHGVLIRVTSGDLTRMQTEAIVNAANNHLWMGGGVAGAIKRAGGDQIEVEAMAEGPVSVGEAVVTGGGHLPARYVIHAVVMGQDLVTSAQAIRKATRAGLERAMEYDVRSVAFPALGTGVGGFSADNSARAMIETTLDFLRTQGKSKLVEIVFVLFSDDLRAAFDGMLGRLVAAE